MKVQHFIPQELTRRPITIAVIGAGGTGSALLPRLMQLDFAMRELGHPGGLDVTVWDDDIVSPSNIGRQPGFHKPDVGQNKAMLMVNRLNMSWGTSWKAIPKRLRAKDRLTADFVIGCVDTRKARSDIMTAMGSSRAYWLDCGNSVDSGQVILGENPGYKGSKVRLPCVADFFPELVDPSLDEKDEEPSCSVADSIRKQSLVINGAMSIEAFNLLWMFIRHGTLEYSGRFVNLKTGFNSPIRMDSEVWARMGYKIAMPDEASASVAKAA